MVLWIIAFLFLVALGIIGYYQGVIRVGFSFFGLLAGAFLALPLGGLVKPILGICGVDHPVLQAFIAPFVAYLLILIAFKIGGHTVHKKVDTWYKYKASDTRRLLFERLSQRVGICLGLANATVYFFLFCTVVYAVGYFTIQFGTSPRDSLAMRTANVLARDLEKTGMLKAVAPFQPAQAIYYTTVDVLADIFYTPLLQRKLSTYPPFLMLAERADFQQVGKDEKFQEFWLRSPSLGEFTSHDTMKPMVQNIELYKELMALAGPDLEDLQAYFVTGESPKYGEEKILGRWKFDQIDSMKRARRAKPSMGSVEIRYLRQVMSTVIGNTEVTATIDNKLFLKTPAGKKEGSWKPNPTGGYILSLAEGEVEARIDAGKLTFTREKIPVSFRRE